MASNGSYAGAKTEFTRRCIGEAVIKLLKNCDMEKLRISEIAKIAGVSRTTFYQYYTTPYSVLDDYLKIIVSEYLMENRRQNLSGKYYHYEHIVFSFNFFVQYEEFFNTIIENRLHTIVFKAINDFMSKRVKTGPTSTGYIRYAYSGALLNCFLRWLEDGKVEKVEDIARTLEMFVPKEF